MLPLSDRNVGQSSSRRDKFRFPFGAVLLIFFQLLSGMGAYCFILTIPIYMATILGYSDTESTIIYHSKSGVAYLVNIVGAVLADSVFGRANMYLVLQPVDILVFGVIALLSVYSLRVAIVTLIFVLAIIGGCLSPALRTFIADQIPSNNPIMLSAYLHLIYLINNLGVIIVAYVAPILHKDIYCFGMECYPLVFVVSFILTGLSFFLFLSGYCCNKFVVNQPTNNLFVNIIRCVFISVKRRIKLGKPENGKSVFDYANGDFDATFIRDVKIAMGLCTFLLAHPLFWTVFEQLSSIWTLQAQYMDGMVSESFVIKPDQMQTLNPVLVVILIPIFEILIYPILNKLHFRVPYRIVAGQMFTVLTCVSMIFIQLRIDSSLKPTVSLDQRQISIANYGDQTLYMISDLGSIEIHQFDTASVTIEKQTYALFRSGTTQINQTFANQARLSTMIFVKSNFSEYSIIVSDVKVQENGGYAFVRAVDLVGDDREGALTLKATFGVNKHCSLKLKYGVFGEYVKCSVGFFKIYVTNSGNERKVGAVTLYPAESSTVIVRGKYGSENVAALVESRLRLPSILWQVIPYVLVTIGEVLFNVNTGIFLYGEAPMKMKSILLAVQYLCIAIGNMLILLLKQVLKDVSNKYLFLVCGILVAISGVLTALLGYCYLNNKQKIDSHKHAEDYQTKL